MEPTPDYAAYSLRQLHDIARRIDREKFAERYALVLREIERKELYGEGVAPPKPKPPLTVWDFSSVALAFLGGAATGLIVCSIILPDYGPDAVGGIGWLATIVIGFFGGGIFCAKWRMRRIGKRWK